MSAKTEKWRGVGSLRTQERGLAGTLWGVKKIKGQRKCRLLILK